MKHNREFEIAWQGLKTGEHLYQYEVDTKFMLEHGEGEQDFKALTAKVNLNFDRQASFFMLHFDVDGKITVPCDRCGDEFEISLWDEFDLLIKLTGEDETNMDEDADVVFIPRSETVIDISKWIYEFVLLSIPLQKVHPDKEDGTSGCNPVALKLLNQLSETDEAPKNNIWKGLEALKDQTNNKRKKNKS